MGERSRHAHKKRSIKFTGAADICSQYLPFAVSKLPELNKRRGISATRSHTYTFSNNAQVMIKCSAQQDHIHITAGQPGLLFIGTNDPRHSAGWDLDTFVARGSDYEYFDSFEKRENLSPNYLEAFYNHPVNAPEPRVVYPKYQWIGKNYDVYAGTGINYGNTYNLDNLNGATERSYFGFSYTEDTTVTVMNKNGGEILALGSELAKASGACLFSNYVLSINKRCEVIYWPIDDPDGYVKIPLNLPAWVGDTISTLEEDPDSSWVCEQPNQDETINGWLYDDKGGVEWKFNQAGTKAAGYLFEVKNYPLTTPNCSECLNKWSEVPHLFTVDFNPIVGDDGTVTISPTLTDHGIDYTFNGVDWDYETDELSYYKLGYELIKHEDIPYDGLASQDIQVYTAYHVVGDKIHHSYNVLIRYVDTVEDKYEFFIVPSGLDLRHHTFSLNAYELKPPSADEQPDNGLYMAVGFDDYVFEREYGNAALAKNWLNYQKNPPFVEIKPIPIAEEGDPPENLDDVSDPDDACKYYTPLRTLQTFKQWAKVATRTSNAGHSVADISTDGVKRFAHMGFPETENNGGEFWDEIIIDGELSTHQEIFESFTDPDGEKFFEQLPDSSGNINYVFHLMGMWI